MFEASKHPITAIVELWPVPHGAKNDQGLERVESLIDDCCGGIHKPI